MCNERKNWKKVGGEWEDPQGQTLSQAFEEKDLDDYENSFEENFQERKQKNRRE